MANINDYLSWRGDLLIDSKTKFNEIDSMILARFSYLLFERINMKEKETIKSISERMKDFENDEFRYNGDKELITRLGISDRFKDMEVTDFIETHEKELEKQFGAITIHISDKELYVSYIGTDSSIFGWKEDFNMSFMEYVPCQDEGKKYLEKIAKKYPRKKIRIGGHSKGGNVAIYSAVMVDKKIQNRIIKVYNYDGPGFNTKIAEQYKDAPILNKIETYLPQDSVIGRIMEHKEKYEIVESIEKGILQHDIYSWQVLRDDFVKLSNLTDKSNLINQTLHEWLENTTTEQRKIFLEIVFQVLYSTNVNTFNEISKNLSNNIKTMFKAYKNISEEEKKKITEMIKIFTKTSFISAKDVEINKFEQMKEHYVSQGKKFIEENISKRTDEVERKNGKK